MKRYPSLLLLVGWLLLLYVVSTATFAAFELISSSSPTPQTSHLSATHVDIDLKHGVDFFF